MDIIIFIAIAFVLVYTLYKAKVFKLTGVSIVLLILLLAVKFGAGQIINKYYFDRYENQQHSDIYKYFDDGHELYKIAKENPTAYVKIFSGLYQNDSSLDQYVNRLSNWKKHTDNYVKTMNYTDANLFSSNRTMARINSLLCFASQGNLMSQTLMFSFISFLGITLIFLTFLSNLKLPPWLSFSALCCSPSLLIWSSSIQKESLLVFGIGLFVYAVFRKNKNYLLLVLACILLLYTAYFILVILIGSWILVMIYQKSIKWFFASIVSGVLLFLLLPSFTNINPMEPITSRYNLQNKIGKGGYYLESIKSGNVVYFEHDEFEKIKSGLKTKTENDLIFFELDEQSQVYNFINGSSTHAKRSLGKDKGWHYQKLHFTPAKSYILHKMLKPELLSFVSHFACALEYTMTIPYYKLSLSTVPFYLESLVLYALGLLFFILNIRNFKHYYSAENLFLLLFAFSSIVLIGYSTPIVGNMIRHKTLAMLLLIVLTMRIGFEKVNKEEKNA